MDETMHSLWLTAERRIDRGLALATASLLWIVGVPTLATLTPLPAGRDVFMCASLGILGLVLAVRPMKEGLRVARAIEERDAEEVLRWAATGIAPAHLELLSERRQRIHYPMLRVILVTSLLFVALALWNVATGVSAVDILAAAAVGCVAITGVCGSIVGMRASGRDERRVHHLLLASSLPLVIAAGLFSGASFLAPGVIGSSARSAILSIVLVIVGIILALVSVMGALGVVAVFFALRQERDGGLRAIVRSLAHTDPANVASVFLGNEGAGQWRQAQELARASGLSWSDCGQQVAEEEFDEADVAMIREALKERDFAMAAVVCVLGVAMCALWLSPLEGSWIQGACALLLVFASGALLYRSRKIR